MKTSRLNVLDALISFILGILAFSVYYLTISGGAYPGKSAGLIVQSCGLLPKLTPNYPLWTIVMKGVTALHVGSVVTRLNLASALFGALSVALIYSVVKTIVSRVIVPSKDNALRVVLASRLAGVASAIFLAFCCPFWIVSNRLDPAAFHTLLFLALTRLLLSYTRSGSAVLLSFLSLLYGIAITEYVTLTLFVPIFVTAVILSMWARENISKLQLLSASLCSIAGISAYFLVAWAFHGSDGYFLREYVGYFDVLWFMWRDQVWSLTRSLPRVGWLIVIFMSITPFLTALAVGRRALNEEKDWSYYILHMVLSGLAVCVLLNVKFAPWPMSGGRLQTMPYVLNASVFGYLVAYWYLLETGPRLVPHLSIRAFLDNNTGAIVFLFGLVGVLCLVLLQTVYKLLRRCTVSPIALAGFAVLCLAPFRNVHEADGRQSRFVNEVASEMVKSIDDRTWLITDGSIDNHLRIAGMEQECELHLINVFADQNHIGNKHALAELDSPRLRNLAQMGMFTLVSEWIRDSEEGSQSIAIAPIPDIWIAGGLTPVPRRLVFIGAEDTDNLQPQSILEEHLAFWNRITPVLHESEPGDSLSRWLKRHLVRHSGLVANNLGVLFEDLGDEDLAYQAYAQSRSMDTNNVSALLNQASMIERGFKTDDSSEVVAEVDALSSRKDIQRLWALSRTFGYVRSPEAFVQSGMTWTLSGRPGVAVSGLQRALEMSPEDEQDLVKLTLAGVYMLEDEKLKSEKLYKEVLAKDPKNVAALLGLSRTLRSIGDLPGAEQFLTDAQNAGAPRMHVAMEWAHLNLAAGKPDEARVVLEELLQDESGNLHVLTLLCEILLHQNDKTRLDTILDSLYRVPNGEGLEAYVRSELAFRDRDIENAHQHLIEALQVWPNHSGLLSKVLRLELLLPGKKEMLRRHAIRLLGIAPNNILANYVMGTIHISNGEYDLAEDSLRRSIAARKSPEALNDLAWLLFRKSNYGEAEKMARESLQLNSKIYATWDTLGLVLMRTGRLNEAETAFKESLSLFQEDMQVVLNMAELRLLQGNKQQSAKMLERISPRSHQLPPEDQERFTKLREKIGG